MVKGRVRVFRTGKQVTLNQLGAPRRAGNSVHTFQVGGVPDKVLFVVYLYEMHVVESGEAAVLTRP